MFVTETKLSKDICSYEIFPSHYKVFRRDRDRHGGGVLIAAKENLIIERREDLETNCEILWCEMKCKYDKNVFLGVYYCPPWS